MNIERNRAPDFVATYRYGAENEQIREEPKGICFFCQRFAIWLINWFAFSLAPYSKRLSCTGLDKHRVRTSKQQLEAVGGESVRLQTPDGDQLEGMYIDAKKFKEKIESHFELVEISTYCLETKYSFKIKEDLQNSPETQLFCKQLKQLGLDVDRQILSFELPSIIANATALSENKSQPTVLIAGGCGTLYTHYKTLSITYLLSGLNVMFLNYRGAGESTGNPSEHKLKLDIETAYQFLHQKKGIENEQMLLHGHCLGSGTVTDLAARRKHVNVLLDRPFSEAAEIMGNKMWVIKPLARKIVPWIMRFKNTEKIQKITGHMAIEVDLRDDSIMTREELKKRAAKPQKKTNISRQTLDLIHHLPKNRKGQIFKLFDSDVGHTKPWHKKGSVTRFQLASFLREANLARNIFG